MEIKEFKKGAEIIRRNGTDGEGYFIESGRVEVYRTIRGKKIVLGTFGPGQTFGEIALVTERPRTASVAALVDTRVRKIGIEEFNRLFEEEPKKILPFVRSFFEIIRRGDFKATDSLEPAELGGVKTHKSEVREGRLLTLPLKAKNVLVQGNTSPARRDLEGEEGALRPSSFPIKFGRRGGGFLEGILSDNDVLLVDEMPFNVSRNHCLIGRRVGEGSFYVQDRGSTLGTIVNGKLIGGKSRAAVAELQQSENEVILGGKASPFKFTVTLE